MFPRLFLFIVLSIFVFSAPVMAQKPLPYSELDGKAYDPKTDPDIDMFVNNWKNSMPRNIYGSLVVRDILTKCDGDPMKPTRKGAVLTEVNSVSFATLEPKAMTSPTKLANEQEMYYIQSGKGVLKSGKKTWELREGIAFMADPGIEFNFTNTGDDYLTMYLISQPIPKDYVLKKELVVNDEYTKEQGISVHWANIDRPLIGDGSVFGGMTAVKLDPMTMAQPHSHGNGTEEVWIALKGDIKILFGKQMRVFPAGSAYRIPWNNVTPHANMNFSDKQVKLIHMMKYNPGDGGPQPYGQLDPKLFDPKTDPDIDQFIGNWRDSMPRILFGSLVVRDILTKCDGDPMKPQRKAAALSDLNFVSRATLEEHASTFPTVLSGEQQIYYVISGTGTVKAGSKTADLRAGISFFIPAGLEFTVSNTDCESMAMYLISEPVPQGFVPVKEMKVVDEYSLKRSGPVHWVNMDNGLFSKNDGLATIYGIGTTMLDGLTIAQPHSHFPGWEEVWVGMEGNINALIGKQLRQIPVGSAYKVPANGTTPHANINITDKPMKLMVIIKLSPGYK